MRPHDDRPTTAGFTLIELLVGMVVFGLLASLGTTGWLRYQRTVEHRATAQELVSALRNAQQSSLAEAVTYCVSFDVAARSYSMYKFSCASGTLTRTSKTQSARVLLESPVFTQADSSSSATISFYPRGSATPGSVSVTRAGSTKSYTINVEGLTGRVALAG